MCGVAEVGNYRVYHQGMTGPPKERGSVRYVKFDSEAKGLPREVRTEPGSGLKPGDIVWVKVGGAWTNVDGQREFIGGEFYRCQVSAGKAADSDVNVVLAPMLRTAQSKCNCTKGFVCEDHPDQAPGHDGCQGAPRDCMEPNCPWWEGTDRSHLEPS